MTANVNGSVDLRYQNPGNTRLLDMLPTPPGSLLDCGCGAGDNARILSTAGWRVSAVTLDPREQAAAREYCVDVQIANLETGLPEAIAGPFDVILMSHVVEHLADPAPLLAQSRDRLGPNGLIAVAVPNVLHYRQRWGFLRGRFDYTDTGPLDRTHLRFYTFQTGRALLEENGLEIVSAVADGTLPWMRLRGAVPEQLRNRVDQFALNRWPDLVAHQSLFLCRRSA